MVATDRFQANTTDFHHLERKNEDSCKINKSVWLIYLKVPSHKSKFSHGGYLTDLENPTAMHTKVYDEL